MKKFITIIISIVFLATCINGLFNQNENTRYKIFINEKGEIIRTGKKPPALSELLPYIEETQIKINVSNITQAINNINDKLNKMEEKNPNEEKEWYEQIGDWFKKLSLQIASGLYTIILVVTYPINAILALTQLIYMVLTYGTA